MNRVILLIVSLQICNFQIYAQVGQANFKKDTITNNFQKYIGGKVYSFMLDDDLRCYKKRFFSDDPPGKAQCLYIRLNDLNHITIYVTEFKVMKQFDENFKWDITKFYEETIKMIEVYDNRGILIKQFK